MFSFDVYLRWSNWIVRMHNVKYIYWILQCNIIFYFHLIENVWKNGNIKKIIKKIISSFLSSFLSSFFAFSFSFSLTPISLFPFFFLSGSVYINTCKISCLWINNHTCIQMYTCLNFYIYLYVFINTYVYLYMYGRLENFKKLKAWKNETQVWSNEHIVESNG